jgi:hypothetical protein
LQASYPTRIREQTEAKRLFSVGDLDFAEAN